MFTLKINTENAAFDLMATELSRILREVARKIERGEEPGSVRDINGNTVGFWTITSRRVADHA